MAALASLGRSVGEETNDRMSVAAVVVALARVLPVLLVLLMLLVLLVLY